MPGIPDQSPDVTALLLAWRGGDEAALGRIVPLVHDELRKIARRCLRGEHAAQSLQATALVNEAYLRLVDARLVNWQNRVHFLAMSARLMRRVLVDAGRARGADKRGGDAVRVSLSEALGRSDDLGHDVVALHDALEHLEQVDARKGRLVELRFFAGLSVEEAAVVLDVSPQTAARLDVCKGVAPEGARPTLDVSHVGSDTARFAATFCGRIGPTRAANRAPTIVS